MSHNNLKLQYKQDKSIVQLNLKVLLHPIYGDKIELFHLFSHEK